MKIKAVLALVATAAACFGGSTLLQGGDWPDSPEAAALLDFAAVVLPTTAWVSSAVAGLLLFSHWR